MAKESKYTAIAVSKTTQLRLLSVRGNMSYNEFFEKICDYIAVTGVDINNNIVPPTLAVKEQTNRVIEVVRGIEKKQQQKANLMLELLVSLSKNLSQNQPENNVINNTNGEISLDEEQLEKLGYIKAEEVNILFEQHKDIKAKYEKQAQELDMLKKQSNSKQKDINKGRMLDAIELINNKKNTNRLQQSKYEISKEDLDMCLNVLKEEIKKL